MYFQWYPGNMAKAKRMMRENMNLVDLVIELVDARIPLSSRNPDIDILGKNRARLVVLNKSDLADEVQSAAWARYFKDKGYMCANADSAKGMGLKLISGVIRKVFNEKSKEDIKRGIAHRPVRAMVVGIPNVGKSTFINAMTGRSAAKTGDVPGVTRDKQWIRLNKYADLLDTPGILPPKFDDQKTGSMLALTGSIKEETQRAEDLSCELIQILTADHPGVLSRRYGMEEKGGPYACLERIAFKRGCLAKQNEPDLGKAARILLDDFKKGRLGRITLERPPKE